MLANNGRYVTDCDNTAHTVGNQSHVPAFKPGDNFALNGGKEKAMGKMTLASGTAAVVLMLAFSVPAVAKDHGSNGGGGGPPQAGTPYGFSVGNASWKSDTGTGVPPGWTQTHGKKKGWTQCATVGDPTCRPPGLQP
jgi:hypothetical protein